LFGRWFLPAILALTLQGQGTGPSYSSAGLVNGATYLPGPLAPNTWTTLYGTNLSFTTATAAAKDMTGGQWPIEIPGSGVRVLFSGGTPAHISYVSPTQINFLTPASHLPGPATITVVRDSIMGPSVTAVFADVSPGLFQNNSMAVASHADGSSINDDAPAHPGEVVVIFGTGLGQTAVPLDSQSDGKLVTSTDTTALRIQRFADLSVTFDGTPLDPQRIQWAGLTPNFAGLYQINLQLPDDVWPNPLIRVWIADQPSADGIRLTVQQPPPPPPPESPPPPE
jgi:uncharacterized protein (TIGR03437 family)